MTDTKKVKKQKSLKKQSTPVEVEEEKEVKMSKVRECLTKLKSQYDSDSSDTKR